MKKILTLIMCAVMTLCAFTACGAEDDTPEQYKGLKFYKSDTGISLYMEKGFTESTAEGVTCVFESSGVGLSCREETFQTLEDYGFDRDMTEQEYAQLIVTANGEDTQVLIDDYGNTYFVYEKDILGQPFTYYGFIDKGSESFWTSNFMCLTSKAPEYEQKFRLWASSITIE